MLTNREDDIRVTQEAARWFMELQTEGTACYASFAQWLRRSPEHVEEFLAITGISCQLDGVDPKRRINVREFVASDEIEIVRLPRGPAPSNAALRRGRMGSAWFVGSAAACLFILAFVVLQRMVLSPETYLTRVGEQRSFKLPDGSLIQLNTRSKAEIRFSKSTREVRLLEGEALFTVESDSQRPFRVLTDTMTVLALGTQFNVYHSSARTTVSVVEGVVQVSSRPPQLGLLAPSDGTDTAPTKLAAGEQANVNQGHIKKDAVADVRSAIAWRERRLIFQDKPLAEVAAEFNRYNSIQLDVEGDAGREPFSGVFAADRPESLVLFLAKDESIRVEQRSGRYIIQRRAK